MLYPILEESCCIIYLGYLAMLGARVDGVDEDVLALQLVDPLQHPRVGVHKHLRQLIEF
jgi:hypothetical protein